MMRRFLFAILLAGVLVFPAQGFALGPINGGTGGAGSSSITIGSTPISGGTPGDCLYVNGTVVGNEGCSGAPGGTSGQLQYNNGGTFGGLAIGPGLTNNSGTLQATLPVTVKTGAYTVATTDAGTTLLLNSVSAATFTGITAATLGAGNTVCFGNENTGALTLSGFGTVYGLLSSVLPGVSGGGVGDSGVCLLSDGTNYHAFQSQLQPGSEFAVTNGVLHVASNGVSLSMLAIQGADTVLLNDTGSAASPAAVSVPSCSAASSALTYNTTTHALGCNSIAGAGSARTLISGGGTAVTLSTTSTKYFGLAACGSTSEVSGCPIPIPAGTLKNLSIVFNNNATPGGSGSYVFTVRFIPVTSGQMGTPVSTSLTCTVTGAGATTSICSDTTDTPTEAAAGYLDVQGAPASSPTTAAAFVWTVEVDPS